jgi:salicylate biosynthesis isochorismate synthase
MMEGQVHAGLGGASAITRDGAALRAGALVAHTAVAPAIAPERVLLAARGPVLFWDAPDEAGRRWSFVGWDEAARIEAQGDARLEDIARDAAALLGRVTERREPAAADAPALRLFGGVSFLPAAQARRAGEGAAGPGGMLPEPPWDGFADASFSLPRWLYASDGERAFLRLVAPREEEGAALLLDVARRRIEALGRAAASRSAVSATAEGGRHAELVTPERWRAMIDDALARIHSGELDKVVPVTPSLFESDQPIAMAPLLERLGESYPECARFAFQRGEATFVGATPERLVSVRGRALEADALAGSASRREGDDAAAARDLLASDKDRREHAVVVAAIDGALRPLCESLDVPPVPRVRTLRNVHHLHSPISGVLAEPVHVLDLVGRLHPTPAVCGTPRAEAMRWICEHEPATRGWYAGAIGWLTADGDGAFSVALRAGLITERRAWLYAGAGVVAGSDADAELAETRLKRRAMLAALRAPR